MIVKTSYGSTAEKAFEHIPDGSEILNVSLVVNTVTGDPYYEVIYKGGNDE